MVFRVFQFINHRNCVILHGNMADAVLVYDKIIFTQTEFSGTLAWLQCSGR